MSEFMHVTTPVLWPCRCHICLGSTGPLVDTMHEAQEGRVYVCELCVTLLARCLGVSKGKRMSELLQAGKKLDEAQAVIADRDATLANQLDTLAEQTRKIEALEALLSFERDQASSAQHLFEIIQEQARAGIPADLHELEEAAQR